MYVKIASNIQDRIMSGELELGDRLPSVTQLQAQYGVDAQPVKAALLVLHTQKIIEGIPGFGTRVIWRPTAS